MISISLSFDHIETSTVTGLLLARDFVEKSTLELEPFHCNTTVASVSPEAVTPPASEAQP